LAQLSKASAQNKTAEGKMGEITQNINKMGGDHREKMTLANKVNTKPRSTSWSKRSTRFPLSTSRFYGIGWGSLGGALNGIPSGRSWRSGRGFLGWRGHWLPQ